MKSIPLSLEYIILVKIREELNQLLRRKGRTHGPRRAGRRLPVLEATGRQPCGALQPHSAWGNAETTWEAFLQGQRKEIQAGPWQA